MIIVLRVCTPVPLGTSLRVLRQLLVEACHIVSLPFKASFIEERKARTNMSFEDCDAGNDSDEEEFMEKVNVYLSERESEEEGTLDGILRRNSSINKTVKFAMDEEELEDAELDAERSRQDLLTKIARLTDMLKEAEEQITTEKDKRKKKEKNLLKLAKELKKRNIQREADKDRMEEVRLWSISLGVMVTCQKLTLPLLITSSWTKRRNTWNITGCWHKKS